jgi:hypothetical protein
LLVRKALAPERKAFENRNRARFFVFGSSVIAPKRLVFLRDKAHFISENYA